MNSKGWDVRKPILDKCLSSARGYSTEEIMDLCNKELIFQGRTPISSPNTIRNDYKYIENTYGVKVIQANTGKNKRYQYEDPNFSMVKSPLTPRDLNIIASSVNALSLYEGRPDLDWIADIKARLQSTTSIVMEETEPIVGFDDNGKLVGREHLASLMNLIKSKKAISLTYKKFDATEPIVYNVSPYYLRQYNNRWFLFGEIEGYSVISNFPLDRIVSFEEADIEYKPNNGRYDFKAYFKDIIGVSRKDAEVENVQLLVSREQYNYILTKPLHSSQEVVEDRGADGVVIQIKVIPNFELQQLLLSFGERVSVLAPASLRDTIAKRIKESLQNYI